ncbi:acyltransferase family protein [Pedobacter suwonensis]|uniref:acyltransferase family protein n=1 Tax=Pedobacter suwonensis TaxID=332999 RepID=UPI00367D4F5A
MNTELTQDEAPVKKSFDFIDTIRCISMIGIVFEHCSVFWELNYTSNIDTFVEVSIMQLLKFATIAFFLISGFLINHKFQEYTPLEYLKNRFNNTIKPWIIWVLIFIFLNLIDRFVAYKKGSDERIITETFSLIGREFIDTIFFTSYWFILNFLICIAILLLFKKYLYKIWFGLILGLISIVYSINLYYHWFITQHSTALFGFIFYLWLGVYLNKYYNKFQVKIKKIPVYVFVLMVVLLLIASNLEAMYLIKLGNDDPYNTLKITNIFYSLGAFLLLLKIGNIPFLQKKFDPRNTTFGIYLVHSVVIGRLLQLVLQPLRLEYEQYSVWTNGFITLLKFILVYSASFWLTKLILKTKVKWIVGR